MAGHLIHDGGPPDIGEEVVDYGRVHDAFVEPDPVEPVR